MRLRAPIAVIAVGMVTVGSARAAAPPTGCVIPPILFGKDESRVPEDALPSLRDAARCLNAVGNRKVRIEGHAEHEGTPEVALLVGERRGKAVKAVLESSGVAAQRMQVVSYGTEKPVCREKTAACWAKNRRVEIVVE